MKNLTRGDLFFRTIQSFLEKLNKRNPEAFSTIDETHTSKFMAKKTGYDVFGDVKPSDRGRKLKSFVDSLLVLVRMFEKDPRVSSMQSFHCLERLLAEQCIVKPASDDSPVEMIELKDPKDVPADSLQNPSDPDATYSAHKGKGMQVQTAETFTPDDEDADGQDKVKPLNLILFAQTEGAHKHDGEALKTVIDSLNENGVTPEVLLADTAYGGDENVEYAKSKGTRLISPVPGHKIGVSNSPSPKASKA
jgi:hypothetical protein